MINGTMMFWTNLLLTSMGQQGLPDYISDILLTTKEFIIKHGYPYEDYTVQTEDGYLLTLQRIPHGRRNKIINYPILLMPGIVSDASIYVNMGINGSLAFILADNGYDVWLGNYRGTTLSRKHITLNPDVDRKKYWNYSFHEIGCYDTPAFIDHILKVTKKDQIFYGGHSQGTTTYLIMLSEKPQYANIITFAALMSPAYSTTHSKSPALLLGEKYQTLFKIFSDTTQLYEVFAYSKAFSIFVALVCNENSPFNVLCAEVLYFIAGRTPNQINWKRISDMGRNSPSGSSIKQFFYLFQLRSGQFRQYDYGKENNLKIYDQETPPYYNLSNVTPSTGVYHGDTDFLTDPKDVKLFTSKLPNLFKRRMYAGFNHLDLIWGIDAPVTVFDDILKDMKLHK